MTTPFPNDERLADLLIESATRGLDAAEQRELAALIAMHSGADVDGIERAVTALALAARGDGEPLPAALRARLVAAAPAGRPRLVPPARPASRGTAGWWAAAAALVLAVAGWYPRFAPPPARPTAPSAAAAREALIRSAHDLVRWEFTATADPAARGASGDVVWDPATQQGYLRFKGLGPNDASRVEYQLWIFDAERDDRYPVDGGVFDIPAAGTEVVIPIHARLHVGKPALFAVTAERPGGVVVSGRERIVVLAKAAAT
jgi:hypothetical protein